MIELKDLFGLLPELVVLATAFVVLVYDAGIGKKGYGNVISLVGYLLAIITSLCIDYSGKVFGMLYRDQLALISNILFIFCGMVTSFYARDYLIREDRHLGEFYGLVALSVCSMMLLASSSNLLLFFLSLEVLSISLYALAGFTRERDASVEASLKYFIIGAFSATFTALGIALLLYVSGSLDLEVLSNIRSSIPFTIGVALIFVSILFKMSAAPFHIWAPDVYQGAPSPSTGFMMTASKAAIFIFSLRLTSSILNSIWYPLLLMASVLSMIVGNITALRQSDAKRILAYSSIAHAGYVLMGYLVAGKEATSAVVFYAISYAVMNLGSFAVLSIIGGKDEVNTDLNNLSGLAVKHPVWASLLSLFLFSLTGIPGTIGFAAKFYLFSVVLKAGLWEIVLFALINSAIAAYYYLKIVYYMFMREPSFDNYGVSTGFLTGVTTFVLSAITIVVGVVPSIILDIVINAVK